MQVSEYKPMLNLKIERVKRNLTQEELAKVIGVAQNTVSIWESGRSLPRRYTFPKIAEALGITVEEVVSCFLKS